MDYNKENKNYSSNNSEKVVDQLPESSSSNGDKDEKKGKEDLNTVGFFEIVSWTWYNFCLFKHSSVVSHATNFSHTTNFVHFFLVEMLNSVISV